MPIYEIRVSGNVPVSMHGIAHRSGKTATEAKRKYAYYLRSDEGGKKHGSNLSVSYLMRHMKARKV